MARFTAGRWRFPAIAFLLAVAVAAPASAQVTSIVSSNTAPKQVSGDPNRVICDTEETTGTRLGRRSVCLTAQQWAEKRAEQRSTVEDVLLRSSQFTCTPNAQCETTGGPSPR